MDVSCNFRDEPVRKQQYPDDDDDDDDFDEQERERMKDLKERDEFADRMKNKDKEKTRQIMSKSEKKVLTMPHSRTLYYAVTSLQGQKSLRHSAGANNRHHSFGGHAKKKYTKCHF